MKPRRGLFITFEGGEGAGKTTQIARLAETLRERGCDVVLTREPGGSPGAEAIRALLLDARHGYRPLTETILFAAARAEHVERLIAPALDAGRTVLCDRFIDSSRAYQGGGCAVPLDVIGALEAIAAGSVRPDLTLILDLDPAVALTRMAARAGTADRFEAEEGAFHARVRQAFLAIAGAAPERCVVIDADRPLQDVAEAVRVAVSRRLPALFARETAS